MSDPIQPIIVRVDSQAEAVDRLVAHCRKLDGTTPRVIPLPPEVDAQFKPAYPENAKACRAAFALHWGAKAMKGQPFIWLEHDSIPLKKGWVKALTEEYRKLGKPFLLSADSHPPHDIVGGIGVYSGDTEWMVPTQMAHRPGSKDGSGWDRWMLKNLGPLIARTPLIQHSYGHYDAKGNAQPHRFPRDAGMIRRETLIFHRDAHQDLIIGSDKPLAAVKTESIYSHAGDLGDVLYALEVIRRLGGGRLMLGSEMGFQFPSRCREPMTPKRVESIKPLLLEQPYITGVDHFEGQPRPEWTNLNRFREIFRGGKGPACMNLQRAPLRRFGLMPQDETQPWLTVKKKDAELEGRIVAARSPRYHDPKFPWKQIVERYSVVFVGLDDEYHAFTAAFGKVERYPTKNLLDVARAIAGGSLFIGNQSCPYAIAEGLKKTAVQESWTEEPNCLFTRPNVLNLTSDFAKIVDFIDQWI